MARKNYSEEFRRQAVDVYESTPGATVRGIAEDLGISSMRVMSARASRAADLIARSRLGVPRIRSGSVAAHLAERGGTGER